MNGSFLQKICPSDTSPLRNYLLVYTLMCFPINGRSFLKSFAAIVLMKRNILKY